MNMPQYIQIIAVVIVFAIYIYGLFKVIKITRGSSPSKWNIANGFTIVTLFFIFLILNTYKIEPADFALIMLTFGLVLATTLYAISAAKQANASVKMAEEMRAQSVMASRPYIILEPVYEDVLEGSTSNYFSHFEVYNAGNGPAIELEISLLIHKEKGPVPPSMRQTFLRAGQSITFYSPKLSNLPKSAKCYLACEYQSIYSRTLERKWYQTRLPFELYESSVDGKMDVIPGELEFCEVSEKNRIDAFKGSKPR